jgi:hypothetical protein
MGMVEGDRTALTSKSSIRSLSGVVSLADDLAVRVASPLGDSDPDTGRPN